MPDATTAQINGQPCRIWRQGAGAPLVYLPGYGGLLHWSAVLENLAQDQAVIAPSLPGWPGGIGHDLLDSPLDWLMALRQLLDAADFKNGTVMGVGFGGAFAAEFAALWPERVSNLVLIGPYGLYDASDPVADLFSCRQNKLPALVSAEADRFAAAHVCPEGEDPVEWEIVKARANEAAARLFWPLGDIGLKKRLGHIQVPTLLIWGHDDAVVPPAYAQRFTDLLGGPRETRIIEGAGHLADFDQPDAVADAIRAFLA